MFRPDTTFEADWASINQSINLLLLLILVLLLSPPLSSFFFFFLFFDNFPFFLFKFSSSYSFFFYSPFSTVSFSTHACLLTSSSAYLSRNRRRRCYFDHTAQQYWATEGRGREGDELCVLRPKTTQSPKTSSIKNKFPPLALDEH